MRAIRPGHIGHQHGDRAIETAHGTRHERSSRPGSSIGQNITRGEIVRAIHQDVIIADQRFDVVRIEAKLVSLDLHMWIDPGNGGKRAFHLWLAHTFRIVNDLPLQVR